MLWIDIHTEFVWPRRRFCTNAGPALITWAERGSFRTRIGRRRDLPKVAWPRVMVFLVASTPSLWGSRSRPHL